MSYPKSPLPASLAASFVAATKGVVAFIRMAWKARANRRAVTWLLHLDDHMLADMGLTHGDVVASLVSPPLADPSTRLRILAVERRAGTRAQIRERLEHEATSALTRAPSLRSDRTTA